MASNSNLSLFFVPPRFLLANDPSLCASGLVPSASTDRYLSESTYCFPFSHPCTARLVLLMLNAAVADLIGVYLAVGLFGE